MFLEPFVFDVHVDGDARAGRMLGDLAETIVERVGYAAGVKRELLGELNDALARAAVEGSAGCHVRFHSGDGQLVVAVRFASGRTWRAARPLPR